MKTSGRSLAGGLTLALALVTLTGTAAHAVAPDPTTTFTSQGNPILGDGSAYSADAAPMVHGDTLFIYAGHDVSTPAQQGFTMRDYQVFATTDLNPAGETTTWDHYAQNLVPGDVFDWASGNNAFAGHVAEGADGRFYWYAPVETVSTQWTNRMAIGVAVADTPVGPWADAIGDPLIDWGDVFGSSTIGQEVIDPHLFRDDDGRVYLYWGSWYHAYMVELEADMVTRVDPSSAGIHHWTQADGLPSFFEAPWVFKRAGTYYLVYDWKSAGSECTPSNYQGCIAYSTSPSPTGPWTYRGLILGGTSATTVHPSVIEFDGAWYITYHTKDAEGGTHFRRSVAIDEITWDDSRTPARLMAAAPTLDPARDPRLAAGTNAARWAHPSASYTETPPMDVRALTNGRVAPGQGTLPPDLWGNYRSARNVQTDWIQLDWDEPVMLNGSGLQFHVDANWIRAPQSWSLQYRDADGAWADVTNPSGFPTTANTWHDVTFDPVVTTGLRATIDGRPNGALWHSVAVSEFEANSVQAESFAPVAVATLPGEAPVLPDTVEGTYPGDVVLDVPVSWFPVRAVDYAAPGEFTVEGRAAGSTGDPVTATVAVVGTAEAINLAPDADVTWSYLAPWNNGAAVNDEIKPELTATNTIANEDMWATWSAERPETQWLQYTWPEPQAFSAAVIGFGKDGDGVTGRGTGVETPVSWVLQYLAGEEWVDIALTGGAEYPVAAGEYVEVAFEPVRTTALRAVLTARLGTLEGAGNAPGEYAAVGVTEWEAHGVAADVTPPVVTTTLSGSAGAGGWYVSPVTVTIQADDDSLQRVDIETSLDGGETWTLTADVRDHQVVLSDGEHELLVRATDPEGNTSEPVTVTALVDTIRPTVSGVADYEERTVTVTAADTGSGLATVEFDVDGAGWAAYAGPLTLTDGAHTVRFRATDVAGNASLLGEVALAPVLDGFIGNVAPFATPTASYTADWNSIDALNDGVRAPHSGGPQTAIWGTWSGTRPETLTVTYTWPVPVTVGSSTIGFWNDGGPGRGDGVETPTGWSLESWDGSGWAPVEVSDNGYPVSATEYTTAQFTPVTTTRLRATIEARLGTAGTTYAAVAVGEWEVYSVDGEVEEPEVPEFWDVSSSHPFYGPIRWMAETGLSTGYGDGSFLPGAPVERQALAAFLYRYAGEGWVPEEGAQSFSDVGPDHPFYVPVEWMAEVGLSTGFGDGTFRPSAQVERQAMASFLHRLVGEPVAAEPASFTDVPLGHPFAGAIAWMQEAGISEGNSDGSFGVTQALTRQATAAFLFRLDALGIGGADG